MGRRTLFLSKSLLITEDYRAHVEIAQELLEINPDDEEIYMDLQFSLLKLEEAGIQWF